MSRPQPSSAMNARRSSRPSGGAHRDVLQVRRLARDAAGRGGELVERRVDAAVGAARAAAARRRRCCAASPPPGSAAASRRSGASSAIFCSESASVDGPVFVRFTGVRPSFSNRIAAQLRRRVDVELLARERVDLGLGLRGTGRRAPCRAASRKSTSMRTPAVFHLARAPARAAARSARYSSSSSRGAQRLAERVGELEQDRGTPAGLGRARVAVEVERAFDLVGRLQLDRQVAQREIFERVLPFTGVEQVRHHRGVVLERRKRSRASPWIELLGPVHDERRELAADERAERLAPRAPVGDELARRCR